MMRAVSSSAKCRPVPAPPQSRITLRAAGRSVPSTKGRRMARTTLSTNCLLYTSVLILGTGGTHNTTSAVARDKGAAKVLTVSRHPDPEKGELNYAEAVSSGAQIVINTTPAGMYPNVGVCNLDVAAMPGLEAVVDVVYNPDKTELILRAEEAGVPVAVGGLEMLVAQAVYAAEYFLDRKFEDAPVEIRRITAALRRDMLNIALIGMPSSGKTTLGRMLAKSLGRTFVDLDEEIVKTDGRSIPDIFAAEGEDGFRTKETAETQRFGKEGRQLISCGGSSFLWSGGAAL